MRFTAFAAPAMMKKTSTYQPQPSGIELVDDRDEDRCGSSFWWSAATQTTAEVASRSSILIRPESPSERRWRTLIRSSRKPIAPQASIVPKIVSAGSVRTVVAKKAIVAAITIRTPPIVGVPCFTEWCSGPSSRMCWPSEWRRRKSMKNGPARIEMISATSAATRTCAMG